MNEATKSMLFKIAIFIAFVSKHWSLSILFFNQLFFHVYFDDISFVFFLMEILIKLPLFEYSVPKKIHFAIIQFLKDMSCRQICDNDLQVKH